MTREETKTEIRLRLDYVQADAKSFLFAKSCVECPPECGHGNFMIGAAGMATLEMLSEVYCLTQSCQTEVDEAHVQIAKAGLLPASMGFPTDLGKVKDLRQMIRHGLAHVSSPRFGNIVSVYEFGPGKVNDHIAPIKSQPHPTFVEEPGGKWRTNAHLLVFRDLPVVCDQVLRCVGAASDKCVEDVALYLYFPDSKKNSSVYTLKGPPQPYSPSSSVVSPATTLQWPKLG